MTLRPIATAVAALVAFSAPLAAQTDAEEWSICDIDPQNYIAEISEHLVGNWTVTNAEGRAVMAGGGMVMPIPIPAEPDSSADFILSGDDLQITSWLDPNAPLLDVAVIPSSPIFDQVAGEVAGVPSQEDVSVVIGCDLTAYPVLQTQFSLSQDGVTLVYTSVFRVLSEGLISGAVYGTVVGDEGSIEAFRPVRMSR